MRTILPLTFFFYFSTTSLLSAQIADDFSDGDFSSNPPWTGDVTQFTVNSKILQLNSSGTDSSYLATTVSSVTGTTEWDFKLELSFSPSSSNYCRIYLSSDQQNLEGNLNGYFLQFGESGSNDAIELFRQSGTQFYSLGRGNNGTLSTGFNIKVKVKLDNNGNWLVFTNYSGGQVMSHEFSGFDTTLSIGGYSGIKCNYTSSNASKMFFDDFYFGPEILDLIPPSLLSVVATSDSTLSLTFNEAIDTISATTISNYFISGGFGNPVSAFQDVIDMSIVYLQISSSLINGMEYTLTANTISDLSFNMSSLLSIKFIYIETVQVLPGDIVITEIMSDPEGAPGLPEAEYVEIYNRSEKYFSSAGWTLSDGSTITSLGEDTIFPGTYRVYCKNSDVPAIIAAGTSNVKGFISFPGLNNDRDEISLKDQNGILLDRVNYNLDWYHDNIKSDGGWSLERVDRNFICADPLNWSASKDIRGGSPGTDNSVNGIFRDESLPYLIHVSILDTLNIQLHFSEDVDTIKSKYIQLYTINNYTGTLLNSFTLNTDFSVVQIQLSDPLKQNNIYTINVSELLSDCAGNKLSNYTTAQFGLPDLVHSGDIIINEILFNPKSDGSDYVEIYNRSQNIIDLKSLKIANADPLTGSTETIYPVSTESRLLMTGNYFAITENPESIKSNYKTEDIRYILSSQLPSYNDDEGVVVLLSNSLDELDRFHYSEKMHFPLLNDVEGISLERISPNRLSNDSTNWHSAAETVGFGTPGYKNSQYYESVESSSLLQIEPELFSPDNDGEKDVINFTVKVEKPGYYASLSIFDDRGMEIIKLAENELLGSSSTWSWNGFTEKKTLAPIGIYAILLRLVNSDGTVKYEKRACVLAHKI